MAAADAADAVFAEPGGCLACVECSAACACSAWQHAFKGCTFESVVIPLDNHADFLAYLSIDDGEGLRLPEPPANVRPVDPRASILRGPRRNSDSDEEEEEEEAAAAAANASDGEDDDDSEDNHSPFTPPHPALETAISAALDRLGGSAFVKLEWSSPQDALWAMELGSLEVQSAGDVFLLLKASDMAAYDLRLAERIRAAHPADGLRLSLTLRKWFPLLRSHEYRCFAVAGALVGISQRHVTEYYSFLDGSTVTAVRAAVSRFYERRVRGRFPLRTCVFDVYVDRRDRVWLLDFAPFGGDTSPLLFTWEELLLLGRGEGGDVDAVAECVEHGAAAAADSSSLPHRPPAVESTTASNCAATIPVRLVTSEQLTFPPLAHHRYPDDLLNLAAAAAGGGGGRGGELEELVQSLQEETRAQARELE